ncbi:hypothetical protein [Tepidibacter thalassicus]|uniref:Uncharacterized protein n=1 Tax=Tepidibacter thalassicus DSM 15285 TaxID=1123350 RepID=A0A1M5TXG0_9FIRM|nr:hypothetical protein [Tepidibacter thalassicus]SHH55409.1 hypothetical protein SAMN02744040_02331 [Tepidibacter thalassicus DSM 15285]
MNIDKIKIGMEFKDYPSLCRVLGVEPKVGGRNTKLHKEEFKRYFNWTNRGRKYIITDIYPKPKEKIDRRGKSKGSRNNNNVYMKYIDPILTNFFDNLNNRIIFITANQLIKQIGIVSSNYFEAIKSKKEFFQYLSNKENIGNFTALNNVFYCTNNILKAMVNSSLNRLEKENIINYECNYILHELHERKHERKFDGINIRLATKKEKKIINKYEDIVLKELKVKKSYLEQNDKLRKMYYEKVNELVFSELKYINLYYIGYKIVVNSQNDTEDVKDYKIKLNKLIKERVESKNINNKKNLEEKYNDYAFGTPILKSYEKDIASESYLIDTKVIIDNLLDLNAKRLKLITIKNSKEIIKKFVEDKSIIKTTEDRKITKRYVNSLVEIDENELSVQEATQTIESEIEWGFDVSNENISTIGKNRRNVTHET